MPRVSCHPWSNTTVPQTVTPYLLYEDVEAAAEFLTRAFGFREVDRATGAAGGTHLELAVGPDGSSVYIGQPPAGFQGPAKVGGTSLVYVLVDDVDTPFGHRRYTCDDPQGHAWVFATVVAE